MSGWGQVAYYVFNRRFSFFPRCRLLLHSQSPCPLLFSLACPIFYLMFPVLRQGCHHCHWHLLRQLRSSFECHFHGHFSISCIGCVCSCAEYACHDEHGAEDKRKHGFDFLFHGDFLLSKSWFLFCALFQTEPVINISSCNRSLFCKDGFCLFYIS